MELYKTSLKDADAAIAIDPNCTKAWYRKGLKPFPFRQKPRLTSILTGMALLALGKKGDAHLAWKQAMHVGGDIDIYMDIVAQFGAGSKPDLTKGSLPAKAVIASHPAPKDTNPTSKVNGKGNTILPKTALPTAETKIVKPVSASRSMDVDVDDVEDLTDRAGGLTLSAASKNMNPSDPLQLAAIAAAKNLITHGIGKASIDEQIGEDVLPVACLLELSEY